MKYSCVFVLCLFALALFTACGGGGEAAVKAQEGFADKACACQDIECVKGVQAEQAAWVAQNGEAMRGSEEDGAKIEAANRKLSECIQKIVQKAAAGR